MFSYKRTIYLRETDATGMLYFSEQFKLAQEALENYFSSQGFNLHEMIHKTDFLLPIVHAEADFKAPLRVGDRVEIELFLGEIGHSSFTMQTRFFDPVRNLEVGTTKIIHVAVSRKTSKSISIPDVLLAHLREL